MNKQPSKPAGLGPLTRNVKPFLTFAGYAALVLTQLQHDCNVGQHLPYPTLTQAKGFSQNHRGLHWQHLDLTMAGTFSPEIPPPSCTVS